MPPLKAIFCPGLVLKRGGVDRNEKSGKESFVKNSADGIVIFEGDNVSILCGKMCCPYMNVLTCVVSPASV